MNPNLTVDPLQTHAEVIGLEARMRMLEQALEASEARARARSRTLRRVVLGAASLAAIGVMVQVGLASAACTQTLPSPLVTLCAGEPAKAANVNTNFAQLVTWMQQKFGTVGSTSILTTGEMRIQTSTSSNAAAASGKPLFISGNISDGLTNTGGGLEVRHDNLTQGVGIGYNTVYATGSNANQDLNLQAKGTGSVVLKGNVSGTGGACYTRWGTQGCSAGYDEVVKGHVGGFESFSDTGDYGASNAECITDSATAVQSWSTYYTRLMRATSSAIGMDAVSTQCSVCCRASCYTALATTTCAAGYASMYSGRVGGTETFNTKRPHAKTMCIDSNATSFYSWTSGYSTRLMRHHDSAAGGGTNGMDWVSNSCAVCCK